MRPPDTPFDAFFRAATRSEGHEGFAPHRWQVSLGSDPQIRNRLLRVPTGFGKTAGVVLAWLYNRVQRATLNWPLRLVLTLPMRTLVEQIEAEVRRWLANLGLASGVEVHVLMGGVEAGRYHLTPESPQILIGTQDMLLSRALNRGYGSRRARWPIDFGLLNVDTLWVLDEVQLMDVGLATSTQLAAFREQLLPPQGGSRRSYSWWMSATLQPSWLASIDWRGRVASLEEDMITIPKDDRKGALWDIRKELAREPAISTPDELADEALARAREHAGKTVLIVVNTVERATLTFEALVKRTTVTTGKGAKAVRARQEGAPELRLVHSRFRAHERSAWREAFLSRNAAVSEHGQIIVATQVVEAGIDLSAAVLLTELAPWSSLVQRFGRCARYAGERGEIVVTGAPPADAKRALPYEVQELEGAAAALDRLMDFAGQTSDASPRTLEAFEAHLRQTDPRFLEDRLYPYCPAHVLRRQDVIELFDTSADLSGADIDISRWIRAGNERDVTLFWRAIEGAPPELDSSTVGRVAHAELCPAPVYAVRDWLDKLRARDKDRQFGYSYDYVDSVWKRVDQPARVVAGMTLLIPSAAGGYGPHGFSPASRDFVLPVPVAPASGRLEVANQRLDESAASVDDDSLSTGAWQTIAEHGRDVGTQAQALAQALGLDGALTRLLELAGRWHDVGKAHDAFQARIKDESRVAAGGSALRREIAKAPDHAWKRGRNSSPRKGFRHELASLCALFELLRRAEPGHPALLGEYEHLFPTLGLEPVLPTEDERIDRSHPLARELADLDADALNLVAYLVLAHHGKLRATVSGSPRDEDQPDDPLAGVVEGDLLPETEVALPGSETARLPALSLSVDFAAMGLGTRFGAAWGDRVARLLARHGPFQLAFLEALFRAADVRASIAAESQPHGGS